MTEGTNWKNPCGSYFWSEESQRQTSSCAVYLWTSKQGQAGRAAPQQKTSFIHSNLNFRKLGPVAAINTSQVSHFTNFPTDVNKPFPLLAAAGRRMWRRIFWLLVQPSSSLQAYDSSERKSSKSRRAAVKSKKRLDCFQSALKINTRPWKSFLSLLSLKNLLFTAFKLDLQGRHVILNTDLY